MHPDYLNHRKSTMLHPQKEIPVKCSAHPDTTRRIACFACTPAATEVTALYFTPLYKSRGKGAHPLKHKYRALQDENEIALITPSPLMLTE